MAYMKEEGTQALIDEINMGFAKKTDIVQPDWNQNDSTQKDYVQNRTHWIEHDGGADYQLTGSDVITLGDYEIPIGDDIVYGIHYVHLPANAIDISNRELTVTVSYSGGSQTFSDIELFTPIKRTFIIHKELPSGGMPWSSCELIGFRGNASLIQYVGDYEGWDDWPIMGNTGENFAFFYVKYEKVDGTGKEDGLIIFCTSNNLTGVRIQADGTYYHKLPSMYLDHKVSTYFDQGRLIAQIYGSDHFHSVYTTPTPQIFRDSNSAVEVYPNTFGYFSSDDITTINISSESYTGTEDEFDGYLNTWEFAAKAPSNGVLNIIGDHDIQWNQPLTNLTVGKWYYCKVVGNEDYGYWGVLNKAASKGVIKGTVTIERSCTLEPICAAGTSPQMYTNFNAILPTDKVYVDPVTHERSYISTNQTGANIVQPTWNLDYITITLDDSTPYDDAYQQYNGPSFYLRFANNDNGGNGDKQSLNFNSLASCNLKLYDQRHIATDTVTKYEYYHVLNPITYMFPGWTWTSGENQGGYRNDYCVLQLERLSWQRTTSQDYPRQIFHLTIHATELIQGE